MQRPEEELSLVLDEVRNGTPGSEERLFAIVYEELRGLARGRLAREASGQTLQTTDLAHEAYLRLARGSSASWDNRRHFFGAAANAMRQILIDRARSKRAEIHGGHLRRVPLEDNVPDAEQPLDLLLLDQALTRLASSRPRQAEVVAFRYFLGLTVPETADLLGIAPRTVDNDWTFAKAWLRREISRSRPVEDDDGPALDT